MAKNKREVIEIKPSDRIVVHLRGEVEMFGNEFDLQSIEEVLDRMREYGSAEIDRITIERDA